VRGKRLERSCESTGERMYFLCGEGGGSFGVESSHQVGVTMCQPCFIVFFLLSTRFFFLLIPTNFGKGDT
jgi:hypothetical protein